MPRARKVPIGNPKCVIALIGEQAPEDQQDTSIRQFAQSRGLEIAATFAHVQVDSDPKGALVHALIAAEAARAGLLLSASCKIAQDPAEAALLHRLAERAGARWIHVSDDTPWPPEQVERIGRVLRMHESMIFTPKIHVARRSGAPSRPGGPPPWGYRRGADGDWEVDVAEQAAVREARARREAGSSLDQIARWLNSLKLPNRGTTYRTTVRGILARAEGATGGAAKEER